MIEKLLKYKTFLTYFVSSGLSFLIDLLAFTVIFHFLKDILVSSYLARVVSSIFNYIVNRNFVFKKNNNNSLISYFTLVLINITISGLLVTKIYDNLSINATLIKGVIDIIIFVINYFLQKFFIFNDKKKEKNTHIFLMILIFVAMFSHLDESGLTMNYQVLDYLNMLLSIPILYILFKKEGNNNLLINVLSVIFSLFMIIGYSFINTYSFSLIYQNDINIIVSLFKLLGYYVFFRQLLMRIFMFFTEHNFRGVNLKFGNHPFLYSVLVLSLMYGLYLIFYYPGVINYDNANQIKEVLGLHTRYLDSIIVLNENVTLTNFNPILHTLLLGNLVKLGITIGNLNIGLFLYTLIQEAIVILVLAYSIYFLKKENIKDNYLLMILLCYIIVPFYPFYALTAVKDTLFCVFVILYIIYLYKYITYKFSLKDYIIFIAIMLLVTLLRTNGAIIIALSLPFVLLIRNINRKTLGLTIFIFLFIFIYNKSLPALNIPNTSIREGLSIPFQQTANYVRTYPLEVAEEEKKAIDKILGYETLGKRYNEVLSDPVKNEYNKYATSEDLQAYLEVWFKMFFKHPDVYFNATLSNTYGYFYPSEYNWYVYTNLNKKLQEAGYDYHFNDLASGRQALKNYAGAWRYIPIINLLVNCAFYTWVYLFLLISLIITKNKKLIIILLPAFSLIAMCFIGPANTYFRYVLPYAMSLPLILTLVIKKINKNSLV